MKHAPSPRQAPGNDSLPFGSDPARSKAPLIVFIVLYAAWFGALVWLAISQYSRP